MMEIDGLAVTSPARTWLDLASVLDLDDLVVAGDFLVCGYNRSHRFIQQIRRLARGRCRRNCRILEGCRNA
ncbi:hypothetical protein [Arthrobacter sp. ISL-30]|uniref:hypothetical protein n=1 Tax=Arthrobacter sp. ISL-30 TaxID=2819109 RepID=UPI001BEC2039|nr:hypothetical protein [Arthrobacter sp. ISL-30]MBT2514130.1 hypothetical protein [Arthrobacter sp. ISL-30]